jgi:hypothetical protein
MNLGVGANGDGERVSVCCSVVLLPHYTVVYIEY